MKGKPHHAVNEDHPGDAADGIDEVLDLTTSELREVTGFLIEQRERLRDVELERLRRESGELIGKVHDLEREQLLEELRCFKEVLSLHKRLLDGARGR